MEKNVSSWLKVGSYILIGLIIVMELFTYANKYEYEDIYFTMGYIFGLLFWCIIFIYCGNKNSKWASKINSNMNLAYAIGFMFSLLGLLGYWIYYKKKMSQCKEETTYLNSIPY